ncbi:MAG: tail fiber domain-containing protein [Candidatus Omnitrophica bacterium]|jgi:hypothetical protein|nr:tail fiber domain-containing protein [Candidatus Omnitrophota bacterium]
MFKYILSLAVCLFFFPVFLFAEEITVTTYYPSPYGVYSELRAKKMAIGDDYIDSGNYTWETVDGDGGEVDLNTDLIVEGNVGIGKAIPEAKLEVNQGMSNYDEAFTSPHINLGTSNTVNNTGFVGITYDASTTANYGWSSGALRSDSGQSSFVWKYHSASVGGTERMRIDNLGSVGIGTTSPGYTLSVAGTIWANGTAITAGATTWSDIRLKKDIKVIEKALNRAMKLRGVYYNWKDNEFTRNFPEGRQIGIIAQEMEKEFPELVLTDKNGYKTIAYDKFTAVLLEAVKEQEDKIESLQDSINSLKSRLDKLENPDKPNKL